MNFKISKKYPKKNNFYETLLLGDWGVNEDAVKSDAAAAVQSIPAYVREGKLGGKGWFVEGRIWWMDLLDRYGHYSTERTLGNCREWITFWVPFLSRSSTLLTCNWEVWDRASVERNRCLEMLFFSGWFLHIRSSHRLVICRLKSCQVMECVKLQHFLYYKSHVQRHISCLKLVEGVHFSMVGA